MTPPLLVSPQDNSVQPHEGVDFSWSAAPGTEHVDVTYRHCIWNGDALYDFNNCVKLDQPDGDPLTGLLPLAATKYLTPGVCILLIIVLIIVALLLFIRGKHPASVFVLILALLLALICYLLERDSTRAPMGTTSRNLNPTACIFGKWWQKPKTVSSSKVKLANSRLKTDGRYRAWRS